MYDVKSTISQIIKRKESLLFLILLIAGLGFLGWQTGRTALASYSLQFIPIALSTIAMFLALSILLLIRIKYDTSKSINLLAAFFIIILAIYCSIILLEYLFNIPSEIENIFINNPEMFGTVLLGRMSPITALLFIFICVSLLSSRQENSNIIKYIGGICSLFVFLISSVLLIGYLYKEPLLYGSQTIPVSLPTAICFFLFSITLLRVFVLQFWTFNLIKDNTVALQLLKLFLPIVIVSVIAQGFLMTNFPIEKNSTTIEVVIVIIIFVAMVIYAAIKASMTFGDRLLRAETARKESEIKYRTIVENVGEGIGFTNLDEKFIFTNSAAERIFGVGEGELIGKNLTEFISGEQYINILHQTKMRKNALVSSYETELTLMHGKKRYIQITAVPNVDTDHKIIGTLAVFREVTERKQAELALKEREKQLLRLNRDKDRFISILGHDLKSPFNTILGFSEVLLGDIRKLSIEEIEDYVNHIYKSAQFTNKLLDDILMWARTQQGSIPFNPQNFSLSAIYKNILDLINSCAKAKNITIYHSTFGNDSVYADADMLKTILLNIVSNAIKFTNRGGEININAKQNGEDVIISVSDNGIGFPPENLSKLFKISEVLTTKGTANETGTGLGLLLCKEFVEKHRGKLWVESKEGIGSTFYFTLPHKPEPKAKQAGGNSIPAQKEKYQIQNWKH